MAAERHGWAVSYDRLDALLADHPIGVASSHVQHNLGPVRREWLLARGRGPLPVTSDGSSSSQGGVMTRDNPDLAKMAEPDPKEVRTKEERFQRDQASIPVTIKGDAVPNKKGSK